MCVALLLLRKDGECRILLKTHARNCWNTWKCHVATTNFQCAWIVVGSAGTGTASGCTFVGHRWMPFAVLLPVASKSRTCQSRCPKTGTCTGGPRGTLALLDHGAARNEGILPARFPKVLPILATSAVSPRAMVPTCLSSQHVGVAMTSNALHRPPFAGVTLRSTCLPGIASHGCPQGYPPVRCFLGHQRGP